MRSLLQVLVLLLALPVLFFVPTLQAQSWPTPVFLYSGPAPGALGNSEADRPRFYPFLPAKRSTSAAILVIPGGGYEHVALGHEGFQIALWLNALGIPALVLDYRVAPYRFPIPIEDGRRAMRIIRAHAAEYGIDPNRLGVWGFSAGGHLASSLGTHCENVTATDTHLAEAVADSTGNPPDAADKLSCTPAFMVLAYPVISMQPPGAHTGSRRNLLGPDSPATLAQDYSNQFAVTPKTPFTFLFATTNDPVVPVANSVDFYSALHTAHVPVEMHLFDYSNHGCGLCGSILPLSTWPMLLRAWFITHSILPPDAPPPPAPEPNFPTWPTGVEGPGSNW